jgi:hypothetical protein
MPVDDRRINFMVHVINEATDSTSDLMVSKIADKY